MSFYRVTHHELGIIVEGHVPADEYLGLIELFKKIYGYDIIATAIAGHFQASLAMCKKEDANAWREALGMEDE